MLRSVTCVCATVAVATLGLSCSSSGDGAGGVANPPGADASAGGSGGDGGSGASGGTAASGGSGAAGVDGSAASAGSDGAAASGGNPDANFNYDAPGTPDADACASLSVQATLVKKPVDIIFVIDNSSSMTGEIYQVQDRINDDFAAIIAASQIDYRVIMVSRYGDTDIQIGGSDNPVCIRQPLGASDCSDPDNTPLQNNPPRFFHYSADVESRNSWCRVLEGFNTPDELAGDNRPWTPLAPNGFSEYLRANAFKTFVEITDDDVSCSFGGQSYNDGNSVSGGQGAADDFDTALLALSPTHFGTASDRNYNWYSIVAMEENTPPTAPWLPTDPIQTGNCSPGSSGPGTGYQALSILTEALRYPTCLNDNFDAMFNAIAQGVIQGAVVACDFDIPQPSSGIIDPEQVEVEYSPGSGTPVRYARVDDLADCAGGDGFYYDDPVDPTRIFLCPASCATVQADSEAQIDVVFTCLGS